MNTVTQWTRGLRHRYHSVNHPPHQVARPTPPSLSLPPGASLTQGHIPSYVAEGLSAADCSGGPQCLTHEAQPHAHNLHVTAFHHHSSPGTLDVGPAVFLRGFHGSWQSILGSSPNPNIEHWSFSRIRQHFICVKQQKEHELQHPAAGVQIWSSSSTKLHDLGKVLNIS